MSALQRVAAIAVALIVVVGITVLALGAAGGPIAIGPGPGPSASAEPSASPSTEPSPAEGSPEPTSSAGPPSPDDEEVLAMLSEIEEQVIAIRGLPSAGIGPADLITRAELGVELQALFDDEYSPDERERDNFVLRAFGLLGPDEDVAELQLQLLGDQVLGFYDETDQRMVVVTDAGLDAAAKLTYAHEYTHALQDAAFGLDTLETDAVGEDDRSLARITLIEGDATVTMLAWALKHLGPEELLQIGTDTILPDTTGIPSWMLNQLQFPYTTGQVWVGAMSGDPLAPDFTEVDAAYADPPDSTEQVMDPTMQSWNQREQPVDVQLPNLVAELGDGWEEIDSSPVGQASIGIMLDHFGAETSSAAADGWGGDRAITLSGPDEQFAMVWRLAWETPEDATEFADAYETVVDALPFPAEVVAINETEVLVVHASTDDLLAEVQSAVN